MILKSWKEIATFLHCGVRTAQRWEAELGLPVRRPRGDRHVVLAFTEELAQWIASEQDSLGTEFRDHQFRQAELRRELTQLRLRQRELVANLRANVRNLKASPVAGRKVTADPAPIPRRSSPAILTVDDNTVQCYAISQILRHAGFTVLEAHTAAEAMEVAKREHPALVLLDIHLPDVTGYELFTMLKRLPQTEDVAVIFYTAMTPSDSAKYVVEQLGAEGFMECSAEPKVWVSTVQDAILKLGMQVPTTPIQ
jgi:CheY-like chemotaxis protein